MKITHERYGAQDDVKDLSFGPDSALIGGHWSKNGAIYLAKDGWRAVPEPRWVTCTAEVEMHQQVTNEMLMMGHQSVGIIYKGFHLRHVDGYTLPDDLEDQLKQKTTCYASAIYKMMQFIKPFRTACLILERQEDL